MITMILRFSHWLKAIPPQLIIAASSVLCLHFHVDKGMLCLPYQRFAGMKSSTFNAYSVPISLSFDALRFLLWACSHDAACNGIGTLAYTIPTHPRELYNLYTSAFLPNLALDPYIRKFVSSLWLLIAEHSNHRHRTPALSATRSTSGPLSTA